MLAAVCSFQPVHSAQLCGQVIFIIIQTRVVISLASRQGGSGFVARNSHRVIVGMNHMREFAARHAYSRPSDLPSIAIYVAIHRGVTRAAAGDECGADAAARYLSIVLASVAPSSPDVGGIPSSAASLRTVLPAAR